MLLHPSHPICSLLWGHTGHICVLSGYHCHGSPHGLEFSFLPHCASLSLAASPRASLTAICSHCRWNDFWKKHMSAEHPPKPSHEAQENNTNSFSTPQGSKCPASYLPLEPLFFLLPSLLTNLWLTLLSSVLWSNQPISPGSASSCPQSSQGESECHLCWGDFPQNLSRTSPLPANSESLLIFQDIVIITSFCFKFSNTWNSMVA